MYRAARLQCAAPRDGPNENGPDLTDTSSITTNHFDPLPVLILSHNDRY